MNRTQAQIHREPQNAYKINRTFKDCLFRLVFQEKEDLLDLYNAVNDSDYKNPEELTVYTLDDAVYICMKNDLSFLMGEMLNLYEHQSTVNPNMPMRGLLYLARNYESYIEQNKLDIYSSVLQRFPLPQYFIFYNGLADEPDQHPLELTAAFPEMKGKEPCLNCKATVLNINYGHNAELLKKCRKLEEYAILIHRIREKITLGLETKEAIDQAIDSCIEEDILQAFLLKHRGEVRNVVLSSFDQENHDRILKEAYIKQGIEIGQAKGEEIGLAKGQEIGLAKGQEIGLAKGQEITKKIFKLYIAGRTREEIAAQCDISLDKINEILE